MDEYKEEIDGNDKKMGRKIHKSAGEVEKQKAEENLYAEALEISEIIPFHVGSVIKREKMEESLDGIQLFVSNPEFQIELINNIDFVVSLADIIYEDFENCADKCLDILHDIWKSKNVNGTSFLDPYLGHRILEKYDHESTTLDNQRHIIKSITPFVKVNTEVRDGLISEGILERINVFLQIIPENDGESELLGLLFILSATYFGVSQIETDLQQFLPHIVHSCSEGTNDKVRKVAILLLKKMLDSNLIFQMAAANGVHKKLIELSGVSDVSYAINLMGCALPFIKNGYVRMFSKEFFLDSLQACIELSSIHDVSSALLIVWSLMDKCWEKMEEKYLFDCVIRHLKSVVFNNKLASAKVLSKYLNVCSNAMFFKMMGDDNSILEGIIDVADSFDLLPMLDFIGMLRRMCETFDNAVDRLSELEVTDLIDEKESDFESEELSESIGELKSFFVNDDSDGD